MRKVGQFFYSGSENLKTSDESERIRITEEIAFNAPIIQLGVQAPPGFKFYVDNDDNYPIEVGSTGIFEIELKDGIQITDITFDRSELDIINQSKNSLYLIIDVIYDAEEDW